MIKRTFEKIKSFLATLEEMLDPKALEVLKEAEEDVQKGRLYTFEEVFENPPE